MTRPRRFDPSRPVELLSSLWFATAMVPVNSGAAAAYRTLFVTVRTVEAHRAALLSRTRCKTIGQLVRLAVHAGL